MMKVTPLLCTAALLAGCTGLNTEFEHAIPAKDSGYWMQQADEMTDKGAANSKEGITIGSSHYIDVKQYKLINTGNLRLPVKMIERNVFAEDGSNTTSVQSHVASDAVRYEPYDSYCRTKYCYPEPNSPLREQDRVSRVWLAPYLSPDNNVHLGEIVYFIAKPSKWAGVEGAK